MLLKRVGSFALISGTLSSFACQSASGAQVDSQKKVSVARVESGNIKNSQNAGKNRTAVEKNEANKVDAANKPVISKAQGKVGGEQEKQVRSILFGEKSDLLVNLLSKMFGVHEHWKSLFETYEGDPYKAAKYALAALLLIVKCWYVYGFIISTLLGSVVKAFKISVSWGDFFGFYVPRILSCRWFGIENNLSRGVNLFTLYAYNQSLPAHFLHFLCPMVSVPSFLLQLKSLIFSEKEILYYEREFLRLSEELNSLSEEDKKFFDELNGKTNEEQLKEKLDVLHNKLTELGYNFPQQEGINNFQK